MFVQGWRERVGQAALGLLYISAGVLVIVDFLRPELRVGRIGSNMMLIAGIITMVWLINSKLSRAWGAGKRSGRREAELEAVTEPPLAVVRDMARPR